jgi:hypothetical protein
MEGAMKRKLLAVAVGSALAAGSALAENKTLSDYSLNSSGPINQNVSFESGARSTSGSFTDTFYFYFSSGWVASTASASGNQNSSSGLNVDFGTPTLNTVSGSDINNGAVSFFFTDAVAGSLSAPVYTLVVTGNADAGSIYGGSLNVALTPVPEPQTLALMLAGFGAIGFAFRRRAQA